VNHIPLEALPASPADSTATRPESPPARAVATLAASATAIPISTQQTAHVGEIVPANGLVALVIFSDLMHGDKTLSAFHVDLAVRARQELTANRVRVLAFGPIVSPGQRSLTQYMGGVIKAMSVSLVDKTSDLFRLLGATDRAEKPTNAVYLVRNGAIVWENVPTRADRPHDLEGLCQAATLHS